MFGQWQPDNEYTVKACFKYDSHQWKLDKVIPDEENLNQVEEVFEANYAALKKIFITQASRNNFPTINWVRFADICKECDIIDHYCTLAEIDKAFIATQMGM